MGNWFPRIYDIAMNPLEHTYFKRIRTTLIRKAKGRVLEIGSGTGVNIPYYTNAIKIDAIEPNPLMSKRSYKRIKKSGIPIQTYLDKAEKLPFSDNTFDSVVATLVFCTIPEPIKALQEIQRVSKPGAKILLFEHVRVNNKNLGKAQDLLTPLWRKVCDGCHLNRDTLELLKQSNLSISKIDYHYGGLFLVIECFNEQ
ncbi:class I SAM-dependent methyltransferase [Paenisporosarcina antarctica]|uniref:Class I SAM-dependent methyltransferase n=1 Tax=Paenisporosarcina antarctica TaxID=417367 RepID=A0A4P6ZYR6_9BACL|nr:methyltransferase domain-containing protein [Paenisporosarcina antarctica]QBP41239.1 class I SAM-dependent methyltransferase [Paenisporosarcina antarctica]